MTSTSPFHARALAWLSADHAYTSESPDAPLRVDPEHPSIARGRGTRAFADGEGPSVHLPVILLFMFTAVAGLVSIRAGVGETVVFVARIVALACLVLAIVLVAHARRPRRAEVDVVLVARAARNEGPLDVRSVERFLATPRRPTWIVGEVGFASPAVAHLRRNGARCFIAERDAFVEVHGPRRGGDA